jgi:NifB/MoaA-like Fe-S oxidoreductase
MLQYLDCQGVSTNIQIVLCPGINDGTVLESTLADLLFKYNHINTVGIVPVARGNHFHGHPWIVNCTSEKAGELIETVERWQQAFRAKRGRNTVFAADEFFILARRPFPERNYYDHFEQLENGIGLCRLFMDEAEAYREKMLSRGKISGGAEKRTKMTIRAPSFPWLIVTGVAAKPVLSEVLQKVLSIYQMDVELVAVPNSSLGPRITVTGLLFGEDIIEALSSSGCTERVALVPDIIFNSYGRTLDGMSLRDLKENTGLAIQVVRSEGKAFLQSILGGYIVGGKGDHDLGLESDAGKTATMVKPKEEIAHVCH